MYLVPYIRRIGSQTKGFCAVHGAGGDSIRLFFSLNFVIEKKTDLHPGNLSPMCVSSILILVSFTFVAEGKRNFSLISPHAN